MSGNNFFPPKTIPTARADSLFLQICIKNFPMRYEIPATRYSTVHRMPYGRHLTVERRATRYGFGQTRRYPKGKNENSKKIFKFSNSLFYH